MKKLLLLSIIFLMPRACAMEGNTATIEMAPLLPPQTQPSTLPQPAAAPQPATPAPQPVVQLQDQTTAIVDYELTHHCHCFALGCAAHAIVSGAASVTSCSIS